jgi:hypothetical protein
MWMRSMWDMGQMELGGVDGVDGADGADGVDGVVDGE